MKGRSQARVALWLGSRNKKASVTHNMECSSLTQKLLLHLGLGFCQGHVRGRPERTV